LVIEVTHAKRFSQASGGPDAGPSPRPELKSAPSKLATSLMHASLTIAAGVLLTAAAAIWWGARMKNLNAANVVKIPCRI
jgi:hypothetical protein